jgi:hypothetical protein
MPQITDEHGQALRRQRRFLVLMSLAVITYFVFGIEFEAKAEYSGLSLHVRDPRFAVGAMWVVWGWALLRYLQCCYQTLSGLWAEIREDVEAETTRIISNAAVKVAISIIRSGAREGISKDGHIRPPIHFGDLPREIVESRHTFGQPMGRHYYPGDDGSRTYPNLTATVEATAAGFVTGQPLEFNMTLSGAEMRGMRLRSWVYAAVGLPAISEHIAPLLFAVFAVVAAVTFNHGECHADWCNETLSIIQDTFVCTASVCPN